MGRRDEPLIVDPTQDVFIVDFLTVGQQRVFLILRTQLVIESMCSKSTDVQVSWNEWGRDAIVMDIPANRISSSIVVHGARLLVICSTFDGPREGYQIHAFDFTRKGNDALLLLDEDDDGTRKRAVFNDGFVFELCEGLDPLDSHFLGDSIAFSLVSLLSCCAGKTDSLPRSHPIAIHIVSRAFLI